MTHFIDGSEKKSKRDMKGVHWQIEDNHIAGVLNLNACGKNGGRVAEYWRDLFKCSQIPCVAWVIPPSLLGKNRFESHQQA